LANMKELRGDFIYFYSYHQFYLEMHLTYDHIYDILLL